ncbi:MAG: hypothetical protein ISR45_03095 [Rhodospirillales bacterium]|nr:hypothetical protein [Rhodospirillales bacterium]
MKSILQFFKFAGPLLAMVLIIAAAPRTVIAEDSFLSAIEDFPLMSGLDEITGGVMVFDSPSGRIVEALTMGKVSREEVLQFYSNTLPQLGWAETTAGNFTREDEILKLEFPQTSAPSGATASGGPPTISVLFMLSPSK